MPKTDFLLLSRPCSLNLSSSVDTWMNICLKFLNKEIHTNADYRPVKKSISSYCNSIEIQECIKYIKYLVYANLFNRIMQKIILKVCKKNYQMIYS